MNNPSSRGRRRRRRGKGRGAAPGQPPAQQQQQQNGQPSSRPQTFLEMLAPGVASDVRQRGDAYFRQGRIFEQEITPERMGAEVRGKGGNYKVAIDIERDDERKRAMFAAVCGCPYFTGGSGYCKHVWAVLCYVNSVPDCVFKSPVGFNATLAPLRISRPRMRPSVVSVEPDATGRIRRFSAENQVAQVQEAKPKGPASRAGGKHLVSWREALKLVGHAQRDAADLARRAANGGLTDVHYVMDVEATTRTDQLTIEIYRLSSAANAKQLVAAPVDPRALDLATQGPDREILKRFFGAATTAIVRMGQWSEDVVPLRLRVNAFAVADAVRTEMLEMMAKSGRFGWLDVEDEGTEGSGPYDLGSFKALAWDGVDPWTFGINVSPIRQGQAWMLRGEFRRDNVTIPLQDTVACFADGTLVFKDRVVRLNTIDPHTYGWIAALKKSGSVEVPRQEQAAFMRTFAGLPSAPHLDLPIESGWSVVSGEPKPRLTFLSMPTSDMPIITANYDFTYETPPAAPSARNVNTAQPVDGEAPLEGAPGGRRGRRGRRGTGGVDAQAQAPQMGKQPVAGNNQRVVVRRNREREDVLARELTDLQGVQASAGRNVAGADVFIDATCLADLVSQIAARGWAVEAEGQKLRVGRSFDVDVRSSSGMDWLDLRAQFQFGDGVYADLPRILETVKKGGDRVVLSDGSVGLLPTSWINKLQPILSMGEGNVDNSSLRYRGNQAAFLDVLVSEANEAHLDKAFTDFRERLKSFTGVTQAEPAASFVGELRPYQCQGLGWLEFLDEFAFGGILADDMGLGKTVQVLAHLQKRRAATKKKRAKSKPSLIVAPTSLIHNWVDEATRFTPDLKVCGHRGASRIRDAAEFSGYDLVVTSYGTMRSDVEMLDAVNFDYVVLDEAQAIKNQTTQVAQAARALKAHRKLAMSGTPVENRLSELGSLFKFLNPGMVESTSKGGTGMADLLNGAGKSSGQLEALAKLIRPFILRRTKEQVLPELPGKTESTVYCVLEDEQRKEYDQLAAFYRASLQKKIKSEGLGKSRMHVLEALLRLRQLACHPGLIDPKRVEEPSAKLDLLEEQLDEVMASGRKALVFSQFTSMLAIVRARLDAKGIVYEYLDGSTTDRKQCVENFQTNKDVRIFLISLKAGGVGLNLTAADYCFILDPWWNPASEAQAIDRAHRIGQKNHVFAYRLIARGTVEEKILAMQAGKRQLVEGILANDGDVMSGITAKDLDFLLT